MECIVTYATGMY